MKKIIAICMVALLATTSLYSQEVNSDAWAWDTNRHTVSISAGPVSGWYLMEKVLFGWIVDAASHAQNGQLFGAYGLQYHYQCLPWLRSGFKVSWEGEGYDICNKSKDSDGNAVYTRKGYAVSQNAALMGSVQFTYLNRAHVQLYSGLDFGVGAYIRDERYDEGYSNSEGKTHPVTASWLPAFNITPIGVAAGGERVFALAEVNLGYESLVKVGIGFHL